MKKAGYRAASARARIARSRWSATTRRPVSDTAEVVKSQLEQLGFKVNFQKVTHDIMYTKFCSVPDNAPDVCPNFGWLKDFNDGQSMLDPTFNGEHDRPGEQLQLATAQRAGDQQGDRQGRAGRRPGGAQSGLGQRRHLVDEQAPAVPWVWDNQANIAVGRRRRRDQQVQRELGPGVHVAEVRRQPPSGSCQPSYRATSRLPRAVRWTVTPAALALANHQARRLECTDVMRGRARHGQQQVAPGSRSPAAPRARAAAGPAGDRAAPRARPPASPSAGRPGVGQRVGDPVEGPVDVQAGAGGIRAAEDRHQGQAALGDPQGLELGVGQRPGSLPNARTGMNGGEQLGAGAARGSRSRPATPRARSARSPGPRGRARRARPFASPRRTGRATSADGERPWPRARSAPARGRRRCRRAGRPPEARRSDRARRTAPPPCGPGAASRSPG